LPRLRDRLAMLDEEARPTVLTMGPETETGETECMPDDDRHPVMKAALDSTPCHYDFYDGLRGGPCSCPAPTPSAP
jgi:hypothetical protein